MSPDELNTATGEIVDAAYRVYGVLGPGLLESAYQRCLAYELRKRGLAVATQAPIAVRYDDLLVDDAYRADMLVQGEIIVELKTADAISALHEAQLLTYLRLNRSRVGLLINFHSGRLKDGIKRMVNNL